jgi:hypothetical protein
MLVLSVSLGLRLRHCQRDQRPGQLLIIWRIAPDCTHSYAAVCCTRALLIAAHFYPPFKLGSVCAARMRQS